MKYTVLLLRPDYASDTFGQDTYLSHVNATTATGAIGLAQREACVQDDNETPTDYYPLAVFAGHLDDLSED